VSSTPGSDNGPRHPSGIDPDVVAKVVARRGRLHAFETLDPSKTALVVIDLNTASVERDPTCLTVVEPVNAVAAALRAAGGTIAWVVPRGGPGASINLAAIVGPERDQLFAEESRPGSVGATVWRELDVADGDIEATKLGASAFFPGRCDLHSQLESLEIDTLLIAGTVTNVCCESSARDATELGYRVTMISDACAGHAHGLHEASLTTFDRIFGDVRPAADVTGLIAASVRQSLRRDGSHRLAE
jgi:ureidoacrylate peracid hydrolase